MLSGIAAVDGSAGAYRIFGLSIHGLGQRAGAKPYGAARFKMSHGACEQQQMPFFATKDLRCIIWQEEQANRYC
jgi:hypothetical protein